MVEQRTREPAAVGPAAPAEPTPPVRRGGEAAAVLRDGGRVLRDAGRLLAEHWPAMVLLTTSAYCARLLFLQLAVVVSRESAVVSQLVYALSPFVQLVAVVAVFLLLRGRHAPTSATPEEQPAAGTVVSRRARVARAVSALVIASAAALLPFLLTYEHSGALAEDDVAFGIAAVEDLDLDTESVTERLAQATSGVVVATVLVALAARRALQVLVKRTDPAREGLRAGLRLASGYCEAVWIVLGTRVVAATVATGVWWAQHRAAGAAVATWWEGVALDAPQLAAWVEDALGVLGVVASGAAVGLLVPLAWLELAAIVYGVEATKVLRARDLARGRLVGIVGRVGDERTDRALGLLTDPERRFGAILGAAALIARAGWRPVLVVCLAFLVTDNADTLLWEVVRPLVGPQTIVAWSALDGVVSGVGAVLGQTLTLALVAAAANSILVGIGLPDALRVHRRPAGRDAGPDAPQHARDDAPQDDAAPRDAAAAPAQGSSSSA